MARYIDSEPLLKYYMALENIVCNQKVSPPSWSYAYKSFIDHLLELPTADVVPRSEVEELIRENKSLAKTVKEASELIRKLRRKDEKAKTKVAQTVSKMEQVRNEIIQEIFEDFEKFIEKCVNTDWYWLEDMVRDVCALEKKYKKYLIGRSE